MVYAGWRGRLRHSVLPRPPSINEAGAFPDVRSRGRGRSRMHADSPPRKPKRDVEPLSALKKTLREHYRRKRAYYTINWPASYERNLYRIFSPDSRRNQSGNAAQFLRHIRRDLADVVARGTGVHHYT